MATNQSRIPAIYYDDGYISLSEVLNLTKISLHAWRYGLTTGKYPQPARRGRINAESYKVSDIRVLLNRLK